MVALPSAEPCEPPAQQLNTSFDASNYYANNFNDFPSAMMTLFDLLIVNNWFIIVDGVVASSGWPEARIFFLAYCPHTTLHTTLHTPLHPFCPFRQWIG